MVSDTTGCKRTVCGYLSGFHRHVYEAHFLPKQMQAVGETHSSYVFLGRRVRLPASGPEVGAKGPKLVPHVAEVYS